MEMNEKIKEYKNLTYPYDMISIIKYGLPKTADVKKITVVGAGIAGLVAASLLQDAGHHVSILEGNNRVGGRIYTVREPFTPGNYIDMGAMRFPDTHELIKEYIKKFNLPTNPFLNTTENDLLFVNGIITTASYYEHNPGVLQFPLPPEEQGKTAKELLLSAVQPFLTLYNNSKPEEQERLRIIFDRYSFEDFLRNNPLGNSLSANAIRMIKVVLGIEGFPEYAFVDIILDIVGTIFNEELTFYEITGGNDQLPKAFLPQLSDCIVFNQKVNRIYQRPNGVTVEAIDLTNGHAHSYDSDFVIVTVPYTVFQFIDVYPFNSFSYKKRTAINELNLISSVKVGIEFRSKFWEEAGIGNIVTDSPLRFTYNPSHSLDKEGPAVMLASYSWGNNAVLWGSLPEKARIREVLEGLYKIYGEQVYREYLNSATFSWSQNQFSAGCFTLFAPYQSSDLGDAIYLPEGRVHFAGEHTSSLHGWVEGGIESGVRAAYEVNARID
ncbi:flavin monoamine oxidase family protein [Virgibacillus flavescens]|uniref:flavin monoamine oxidase family protein n=1 Tax=Virgibacillus flavescens TaxID=1611422 RepID=UPI003D352340